MVPQLPALYLLQYRCISPSNEPSIHLEHSLYSSLAEAVAAAERLWESTPKEISFYEGTRAQYADGGPIVIRVVSLDGAILWKREPKCEFKEKDWFGNEIPEELLVVEEADWEEEEEVDEEEESAKRNAVFYFVAINHVHGFGDGIRLPKDLLKLISSLVTSGWKTWLPLDSIPNGGEFNEIHIVNVNYIIPTYDLYALQKYRVTFGTFLDAQKLGRELLVSTVDSCWRGGFTDCILSSTEEPVPSRLWNVDTCSLFSTIELGRIWKCDDNLGELLGPASLVVSSYKWNKEAGKLEQKRARYKLPKK